LKKKVFKEMIFPSFHIKISKPNSPLWETDNFSIFKVVKNRKYLIQKNQNELYIEREKLDIFDSIGMGFGHMKRSAFAKGTINERTNNIDINLEISIKPFYKKLIIVIFSILYLFPLLICFESWIAGIYVGFGVTLFCLLYMVMWNEIIENFKYELESDIQHFDSEI